MVLPATICLYHELVFSQGSDHLWQSGPSMAAIVGPEGPSTATQFAVDGPGDQLWQGPFAA